MKAFFTLLGLLVTQVPNSVAQDPCRGNNHGCDLNNGLCWATSRTTNFCTCKVGYEPFGGSIMSFCVDVNECNDPTICTGQSRCTNTAGSYICRCKCGYVLDYTGNRCVDASRILGKCEVPQWCESNSGFGRLVPFHLSSRETHTTIPMDDPRQRILRVSSKVNRMAHTCGRRCEEGFEMNSCGYCADKDECSDNPCTDFRATCVNTAGSYYCDCPAGFVTGPCGTTCYRQDQPDRIPGVCTNQDLSGVIYKYISWKFYEEPVPMLNYDSCAPGVGSRTTTIEKFDTSGDGTTDLVLTWYCARFDSRLKSVGEAEASWDNWSCWTECKATCWGGLQTRVRKCLNGVPGLQGCAGRGSEKRECFTGVRCQHRIRRDAETLTSTQERDLLDAMEKFKADRGPNGFFNAAAAHGWPGQCEGGRSCCPHGARMTFLSWHRSIILNFEMGLARHLNDKTLGVPYWNWLRLQNDPSDLAFSPRMHGRDNPFASMTVRIDLPASSNTNRDIERTPTWERANRDMLNRARDDWNNVALDQIRPHTWMEFSEALESAHGMPHVAMCLGCRMSMAQLAWSGFDPIFMFHHGQIDRLWAVAQYKMEQAGNTTWTPQTALEPTQTADYFGRSWMPFANKTLNPYPLLHAVSNMRDSYYYEELTGVKYDFLGKDGRPEVDEVAMRDLFTRPLTAGAFVAHYLQNVENNIEINYYLARDDQACSSLTRPIASTTLQATQNPFENSVPRLMSVLNSVRVFSEINIKVCYTSREGCRERCPEVSSPQVNSMPDPFLVYYIVGQPIDIYKVNWSAGKRLPQWFISTYSKTQWFDFFGDRANNIRQVSSYSDWYNCSASRLRTINCSSQPCLLKSGIYYFIDSSRTHCNNGLKMRMLVRQ